MTIAFLNLAESSLWLEGGRVSGVITDWPTLS